MPRRALIGLVLALVAAGTAPAAAGASHGALTATDVRFGAHPGLVRVVVEFRGTGLELGEVELAGRPRLFGDGKAKLLLRHAGAATTVRQAAGRGVQVRVRRRGGELRLRLRTQEGRFKAVEERVLRGPDRLVLDLWKAKPPRGGAIVTDDGCLRLGRLAQVPGTVQARGRTLQRLFENALVLIVRNRKGRILDEVPVTAARRKWKGTARYRVSRDQDGTLEAAVFSARDGSLECLVQTRLRLVAPLPPVTP